MKLRVLLISHTCQSRRAGQPKAFEIASRGDIDLTVLTPRRWKMYGAWSPAESPEPGAPYQYLARPVRFPWVGPAQNFLHHYPSLPTILREFNPHVIDVWEEPWALVSAQVCWLRPRLCPNAKVISETEQNIHKRLPPPFAQIRRYVARRADFLVARNAEAVGVMRREGYTGPAQVVPNAVDADLFHPMPRSDCRARLGIPAEPFLLGYVGRLVEEKGLDELIQALTLLPPHCRLLLVGDGPLKPTLAALVDRLGLQSRVEFRSGVSPEALVPLMAALNVLVLPSRTTARWKEQFGRVLIEAMACGVPVAGSDSGAIPEVIGATGAVFRERDPADLARAVRGLLDHPDLCQAFATEGRARVLGEFTWKRVADTMADIYHRIAPGLTPAAPVIPPTPAALGGTVGVVHHHAE